VLGSREGLRNHLAVELGRDKRCCRRRFGGGVPGRRSASGIEPVLPFELPHLGVHPGGEIARVLESLLLLFEFPSSLVVEFEVMYRPGWSMTVLVTG
jgi:hypothetical protein